MSTCMVYLKSEKKDLSIWKKNIQGISLKKYILFVALRIYANYTACLKRKKISPVGQYFYFFCKRKKLKITGGASLYEVTRLRDI